MFRYRRGRGCLSHSDCWHRELSATVYFNQERFCLPEAYLREVIVNHAEKTLGKALKRAIESRRLRRLRVKTPIDQLEKSS